MTKKQKQILITVVLLVILILKISSVMKKRAAKKISKENKLEQESVAVSAKKSKPLFVSLSEENGEEISAVLKDISSKKWGRDPFIKKEEKVRQETPDLFLSGIMWEENDPRAIINEELVKVGDMINGRKIKEIKENNVVVGEGEKEYILELWIEEE